jgi:hypothetical protein
LTAMMSNLQSFSRCVNGAGSFPSASPRAVNMRDGQTGNAKGMRSRVCLDCAMPLRTAGENQTPECHCYAFEDIEDDQWDFGGVGPLAAFCIGLTCLLLACGYGA